jgi:hypothetical protein
MLVLQRAQLLLLIVKPFYGLANGHCYCLQLKVAKRTQKERDGGNKAVQQATRGRA